MLFLNTCSPLRNLGPWPPAKPGACWAAARLDGSTSWLVGDLELVSGGVLRVSDLVVRTEGCRGHSWLGVVVLELRGHLAGEALLPSSCSYGKGRALRSERTTLPFFLCHGPAAAPSSLPQSTCSWARRQLIALTFLISQPQTCKCFVFSSKIHSLNGNAQPQAKVRATCGAGAWAEPSPEFSQGQGLEHYKPTVITRDQAC